MVFGLNTQIPNNYIGRFPLLFPIFLVAAVCYMYAVLHLSIYRVCLLNSRKISIKREKL
jgi:hypothetical protein